MGMRGHRSRVAAALIVAGLLVAAGCSGDDDEGGAASSVVTTPGTTSAGPATTVDPLAESVVDSCGNDLSSVTSTVTGVDPVTGTVRWTTTVPLAETFLLRDPSGPRLSLVQRDVEAVLDAGTGEVVEYPTAGVHEVLIDPAGAGDPGLAGLLVDGVPQPATIEVGGLRITTAAGQTGQTTIGLTATDAATSAPSWRADLGPADEVAGVSGPVLFGDTVVVVTSSPRPACESG